MSKQTRALKLLTKSSVGVFHSKEWMRSGYALLASSRTLRATWTSNQRMLKRLMRSSLNIQSTKMKFFERDRQLLGPSLLLLGYAAEMFLKGGLAKTLNGCSEQLFKTLSSKEYSHNLQKIAQAIYFKLDKQSIKDLISLQACIESEGRYPIEAQNQSDHITKSNELRLRSSSKSNYRRLCTLVRMIARHSVALGGTTLAPVSTGSWRYDEDGYISLWSRPDLPPRITFRLSSELEQEEDPMATLRDMIRSLPNLEAAWDRCDLYEEVVETKVQLKKRAVPR